MLGFLPTRAYRPGTPGATTFLSPLSGTFNYGWDSFALWTLDLNSNQLNVSIPSELGMLTALRFLRLHDNKLGGSIPVELVLCSQSLFRFADLGDDGLCRGDPDKGCGVIVSAIDVVVDRLD